MDKHLLILIPVFLCTFSSCEKTRALLPPQKIEAKDFPISMGSYWEYAWWDVLWQLQDTMRGTIIAEGIKTGGKDDLWMLEWKTRHGSRQPDTQYVHYTEEHIIFYDYHWYDDSLRLESQYNFPFQVGDEWTMDLNQGTYNVLGDRLDISDRLQENFGKAIYMKRNASGANFFSISDNVMFIKGVGIAWRNFNVTDGIPFYIELFELIDYDIK